VCALGSLVQSVALRLPVRERELVRVRLQERADAEALIGSGSGAATAGGEQETLDWDLCARCFWKPRPP
jgi:hypothetical protein